MGQSNYDGASQSICKTQMWNDYRETVRKRIATFELLPVTEWDTKRDQVAPLPVFKTAYAGGTQYPIWFNGPQDGHRYEVDFHLIANLDEMRHIVTTLWNETPRKIATYGCRLKEKENGPRRQKSMIKHFPEYAEERLRDEFAGELKAATWNVRRGMAEFYAHPDFVIRQRAAVERACIDEVKSALMRYRHVPTDVLKTAFLEFITEDVLSC